MGEIGAVTVRREGQAAVAAVTGEVDISNADAVRDALLAAGEGASGLVVDLSETEYLDSSWLRVSVEVARALGERDIALRLAVPRTSPVWRALNIAGLAEVAPIDDDLEQALRELGRR